MSYNQRQSNQYYSATESSILTIPKNWKRDGSSTGVIALVGANGGASLGGSGGQTYPVVQPIADLLNVPTLTIDAGSNGSGGYPEQWANSNSMTAIANAVTWATAAATYYGVPPGFKNGPVILVGISKGGAAALNFAARNPTLVKAMVLIVPMVDEQYFYANNAAFQASMDTAYGGSWATNGQAAVPSFNPTRLLSLGQAGAAAIANIPALAFYSRGDGTVSTAGTPVGQVPDTLATYAGLYGAKMTTLEIPGSPAHAAATTTLTQSIPTFLGLTSMTAQVQQMLAFISANL